MKFMKQEAPKPVETKHALAITIKAGVIDTVVLDDANPDEFLAGVEVTETFPVVGWKFSEIHLVEGNQENGKGYAFF